MPEIQFDNMYKRENMPDGQHHNVQEYNQDGFKNILCHCSTNGQRI